MATILGTHYVFMPLRVMTESCVASLLERAKSKQHTVPFRDGIKNGQFQFDEMDKNTSTENKKKSVIKRIRPNIFLNGKNQGF